MKLHLSIELDERTLRTLVHVTIALLVFFA